MLPGHECSSPISVDCLQSPSTEARSSSIVYRARVLEPHLPRLFAEPEYSSPIFLDCCGLIRRVLRDLRSDFGFRLGPWNQGYMYDTLPVTVEREEDMKPGDLVFISATYYNSKSTYALTHI